jgi:PAS domain S-box-containing protein
MELRAIVRVDKDRCVNCHACISACPVKYCNDGSGDYVRVNADMCIGCGNCLAHCTHQARYYVDDFDELREALTKGEKVVAIVAPSVAASFPGQYLNLNGWLKSIGIEAVFDVSFGAELSVRSCLDHLDRNKPRAMISSACPAIVTYIELYRPELIQYLIPVDSPMIHTIKMIRRFYPSYRDHKVAAISPCMAKKREFIEAGLGDYNISYASIDRFLKDRGMSPGDFPEVSFDNPPAERAVSFSTPGGLLRTLERSAPGIRDRTRKIDGVPSVYEYLARLKDVIDTGRNPLLIDCLNCELGCNGGTLTMVKRGASLDEIEYPVDRRAREAREIYGGKSDGYDTAGERIEETIGQYWAEGLYSREYRDLSENVKLRYPDKEELAGIYRSMYKFSADDIYNCTACGYNSCENMAIAIFNHLNRPENCHFYLARETELSHQKILKTARRLSTIFDASMEGLMQMDKEGIIVAANPAMKALLDSDDLVGHSIFEYLGPGGETIFRQHSSLYTEKVRSTYEIDLVRPDGTMPHCLVSVAAVFDERQELLGEFAIISDITERQRSEALRARQAQLSEAMDLAHVVYWEFDATTDTYVFNDPFYAFYRTSAAREGGYRMARAEYAKRFVHPDDLSRYREFTERSARGADPELIVGIEHRIIRRDGSVRHIMARSRAVTDELGNIVKRHGANQDITDRKHAEEALSDSEAKYRSIFENAIEGIYQTTPEGRYLSVNPAFARMFGFASREEMMEQVTDIGRQLYVNPGDRERLKEILYERGHVEGFEAEVRRKDGTTFWISINMHTVSDADGALLYFEGTNTDITEVRHLESQLRQAQKMEAVGTLTGGIAHDFNNILMAVMGYGSLLQMRMAEGDPLRPFVDEILSGSEKAARLTQTLLAFSRQRPVVLNPLNLNDTIRGTEKLLKRLLIEDISLRTVLAADDMVIIADATQIDQMLFNLATNARDAMPGGGILTIETRVVELDEEFIHHHGYGQPGRYALLSVSDTGVGMDETTREKIFDPFFTTKEVGKGTGLGLSTVYGAVKQQNGFISVHSKPNVGTTFHIYLPIANGGVKREEPAPVSVKGGTETILVAEDNEAARSFLKAVLLRYGYSVIEARDGEEAIEEFKKACRIDLLLFDSVMPVKNGREAYDAIRNIRQDIKVLFTSGYTRDVVLDRGIEDKKFHFVSKPILPETLLTKVREVLDEPGLSSGDA